jgi:hypothetical protein
VELAALGFQAVGSPTLGHPCQPHFDGHVEEHGEVGLQSLGRHLRQGANALERQPSPEALISHRGVHVAVADHGATLGQGGLHHLGHVLGAIGEVEQQLGWRCYLLAAVVEDERADGDAQERAAGLLGEHHLGTERFGQQARLGALPAALDAFEGDERHRATACGGRDAGARCSRWPPGSAPRR